MKTRKCPICGSSAKAQVQSYSTGKKDKYLSREIVAEGIEIFECINIDCQHRWLPLDQERKIDQLVARETRFDLLPKEISLIRESLPFSTKYQTAEFLCLNEKAFTKWELGYSGPNRAYDLLLRLAVFNRENFVFIQHLHKTNFQFNPNDYQLICEKHNLNWQFKALITDSPKNEIRGSVSWSSIKGKNSLIQGKDGVFVQGYPIQAAESRNQEELVA